MAVKNNVKGHLLLISQPDSYRIAPYLNAAKAMGIKVTIASRGKYSLVSEVHEGLHVDLDKRESACTIILKEARYNHFNGILGCDDSTVELAARVAQQLNLPHNPIQATRLTCRKDLARATLAQAGCLIPAYILVDLNTPLLQQRVTLPFPCVLKPLSMSASRGVIRANNSEEFILACQRIKQIITDTNTVFEQTHILVEQYIAGVEVAYEGYLYHGKLTTLALFDKPDPLEGPYFTETIYVTPSQLNDSIQQQIKHRVEQAINAYGLSTGPIHAELRIDSENKAWLLEIACRTMGGDCARTLDVGNHFTLEQLIISIAINQPIKTVLNEEAHGVMMIPIVQGGILKRVEGLSAARKVNLIEKVDIIAREGHELIPLPEGNQYAGYIFAKGSSAVEVTHALKIAYAHLRLVVTPLFKILSS